MSYEGYVEFLCGRGHHWDEDAHAETENPICPRCGGGSAWRHAVDQTNGIEYDDDGKPFPDTVPWALEVDHYEETPIPAHIEKTPCFKLPTKPAPCQPSF